jgi:hypothetical protein
MEFNENTVEIMYYVSIFLWECDVLRMAVICHCSGVFTACHQEYICCKHPTADWQVAVAVVVGGGGGSGGGGGCGGGGGGGGGGSGCGFGGGGSTAAATIAAAQTNWYGDEPGLGQQDTILQTRTTLRLNCITTMVVPQSL